MVGTRTDFGAERGRISGRDEGGRMGCGHIDGWTLVVDESMRDYFAPTTKYNYKRFVIVKNLFYKDSLLEETFFTPKGMTRTVIFDDMAQCTEEGVQGLLPLVAAQRREQALAYKHTFGRFACLKSYVMLRELLLELGAIGSDELPRFVITEHGKPELEGHSGLHFSISHCRCAIAVAVSDAPVGIDAECRRKVSPSLLRYTMNDEELGLIEASADPEGEFTRLWTRKEAVLKQRGTGITADLKDVLVGLPPHIRLTTHDHAPLKYFHSLACESND